MRTPLTPVGSTMPYTEFSPLKKSLSKRSLESRCVSRRERVEELNSRF